MKRYLRIFSLYAQGVLVYKSRAFVWFLIALLNPLLVLLFWYAAYLSGTRIEGLGISTLSAYYLLQIILRSLLWARPAEDVAITDIGSGELFKYLLRPYSYFLVRLFEDMPWRLLQAVFGIGIVGFLYIVFGFQLHFDSDPRHFVLIFVICANGYLLSFLLEMILGFTTFWLTDFRGLQQLFEVTFIIFAGTVMPLSLFPEPLKTIALHLPFAYMLYAPIVSLQGMLMMPELVNVLLAQYSWIAILGGLYMVLWKKGLHIFTGVSG